MEQQPKKLAAASSSSAGSGSSSPSSPRSIQGSMSSAFLGASSSATRSQSQRLSPPPLLYPPPAPLPGHLASRGSAAASGGSASAGSSSSYPLHQISPSPGSVARRRPRPSSQITLSLPTPFLSELSSIRTVSANLANVFGGQEIQRPLLHGQQQEQEMTRPSWSLTMPHSHHNMPNPIGESSGSLLSASQQQHAMRGLPGFEPLPLPQEQAQPSFSRIQPLAGGNFSGFPLAPSQPQHMQPSSSSSTDLPGRIFSGFEPPATSQHFSTHLAPLPSGSTIFQSYSSCSADHAQPLPSDSELPPLPPSLEIRQCDLPPLGQLSSTIDQSRSAFVQPSETYDLAPLPESVQMPPPHPMDEHPSNLEQEGMDMLQMGGSGNELTMTGVADGAGVGQTLEATRMPVNVHDKVNNGGGSSSGIIWNGSREEEQALQQLRNLLSRWSSSTSSISSDQSIGSSAAASSWAAMPALTKRLDTMSVRGSSSSSMSRRRGYFSEADMERITKDNRLKELATTDSKRVKKIFRNRESVVRLQLQKASHLEDLQRRVDALKMECSSLSTQVQSHQEMMHKLKTENRAVELKLKGLKDLDKLKQALNDQLQSELQRLQRGS